MCRRLLPALALAALLAGCGGSETSLPYQPETQPPAAEPGETGSDATTSIVVYFTRGEHVAPVHREVPQTAAVGTAALGALLEGPTAAERSEGVSSNVPEGTQLHGLTVSDGTATVDLSREFESGGGTLSMTARLAELVFTLTQFPTVERVALRLDGERVSALGGEGIIVDEPLTRADFAELTPLILVERPALGETVSSPVQVSGTASVYEATLRVRLVGPDGETLWEDTVTAGEGAPGRGPFAVGIPFAASGAGEIVVFSPSAADGSEQHRVAVPVRLAP